MASNRSEENEEFITCGICFYQYDDELRKPKFLVCSHTFCLSCLKVICSVVFSYFENDLLSIDNNRLVSGSIPEEGDLVWEKRELQGRSTCLRSQLECKRELGSEEVRATYLPTYLLTTFCRLSSRAPG